MSKKNSRDDDLMKTESDDEEETKMEEDEEEEEDIFMNSQFDFEEVEIENKESARRKEINIQQQNMYANIEQQRVIPRLQQKNKKGRNVSYEEEDGKVYLMGTPKTKMIIEICKHVSSTNDLWTNQKYPQQAAPIMQKSHSEQSILKNNRIKDRMEDEEKILKHKERYNVGISPPFLPPKPRAWQDRITLVLDMDQTLIDSYERLKVTLPSHVNVNFKTDSHNVVVRPGVYDMLEYAGEHYEVIIYSASTRRHLLQVVAKLDPECKYIHGILSREHTVTKHFTKDLSLLGRPLERMAIIDDLIRSVKPEQFKCSIPITPFDSRQTVEDDAVINMMPFLKWLPTLSPDTDICMYIREFTSQFRKKHFLRTVGTRPAHWVRKKG